MCVQVRVHGHLCVPMHTRTCSRVTTCVYVPTCARVYARVYVRRVHTCVYMPLRTRVYTRMCMCAHV